MRFIDMIQLNIKVLKISLLFIVCFVAGQFYGESYHYEFDYSLKIYDSDSFLFEVQNNALTYSKLAFVWKDKNGYCCYIKEKNILMQNFDWAYTNDFGIILKNKNNFQIYDSHLNKKEEVKDCDFIVPLPFDKYAYQYVDYDYNITNIIVWNNKKTYIVEGNIVYYKGGVVFRNRKNHIVIISDKGEISKNAKSFFAQGDALWLFYEHKTELYDSNLQVITEINSSFDNATAFFDGKSVLINHSKGEYYLFNLQNKSIIQIKGYTIVGNNLIIE